MSEKTNYRKVDDVISAIEGGQEFSSDVAKHLDTHVRKSIQVYEELEQMTADISGWFVHNGH